MTINCSLNRMKPNIIYLNSHDTGRWIQPYGYPVSTPNLQRFAENAVVFRNAFCMNPTCSPSRAAMLTGQAPHSSGMLGLAHLGWGLTDMKQHWIHTLHDAGYTSYFTGGQHLAPGAEGTESIGYHHILEAIGEHAWAERAAELFREPPAQPFYLEVGFSACHRRQRDFPDGLPRDDPRWQRGPACLPDEPRVRREFAGFKRLAAELDENLGVILAGLESSGLADNTVVVITTDHGIDFPHMKCTLRDDGLGVFLMIRGPQDSNWRGGRVLESLVSHVDVFPTLCDFVGCEHPDWLQGRSLMRLVDGDAEEVNDAVYGEVNYHAAYQPMRAIRTKRWKYIRHFYQRRIPVPPNQAPCDSRDIWDEQGWLEREEAREELYDLTFDPTESNNLAECDDHAEIKADLQKRLRQWMEDTDDPLLQGHIPLNAGGRTVTWDQLSNHGSTMAADEWNAWLQANEEVFWIHE